MRGTKAPNVSILAPKPEDVPIKSTGSKQTESLAIEEGLKKLGRFGKKIIIETDVSQVASAVLVGTHFCL